MVILLLNENADVNVPDNSGAGATPLTIAAGNGNTETVLVLLGAAIQPLGLYPLILSALRFECVT